MREPTYTGNNIAEGTTDQPEDTATYTTYDECEGTGQIESIEGDDKTIICDNCKGKGYIEF